MTNPAIAPLLEQSQVLLTPMVKFNKLTVITLEKLVTLQMATLESYVNLGMRQLKAAFEVNNSDTAHTFLNSQVEAASIMRKRILEDAKALVDLGADYKTGMSKMTEESIDKLTNKASEAVGTAVEGTKVAA